MENIPTFDRLPAAEFQPYADLLILHLGYAVRPLNEEDEEELKSRNIKPQDLPDKILDTISECANPTDVSQWVGSGFDDKLSPSYKAALKTALEDKLGSDTQVATKLEANLASSSNMDIKEWQNISEIDDGFVFVMTMFTPQLDKAYLMYQCYIKMDRNSIDDVESQFECLNKPKYNDHTCKTCKETISSEENFHRHICGIDHPVFMDTWGHLNKGLEILRQRLDKNPAFLFIIKSCDQIREVVEIPPFDTLPVIEYHEYQPHLIMNVGYSAPPGHTGVQTFLEGGFKNLNSWAEPDDGDLSTSYKEALREAIIEKLGPNTKVSNRTMIANRGDIKNMVIFRKWVPISDSSEVSLLIITCACPETKTIAYLYSCYIKVNAKIIEMIKNSNNVFERVEIIKRDYYVCDRCYQKFNTEEMDNHKCSIPYTKFRDCYTCSGCNEILISQQEIDQHENTCPNKSEHPEECSIM